MRLVIFVAMAAFLVAALCVPGAFGARGAAVRVRLRGRARRAHRAVHAGQPRRRRAAPVGPRARGQHGDRRRAAVRRGRSPRASCSSPCGALALLLDTGGPFLFGADGWKLVPGHFAERHGLIVIIALGRVDRRDRRRRAGRRSTRASSRAAVLGIVVAAALWWVYFDVTAIVAGAAPGESARRAASATRSRATPTPTCTSRWSPASR